MRTLALLLALLLATPALADDAPRRVSLEPASAPAAEPAFDAAQHPVIAVVAISGAVALSLAIVVGLVLTASHSPYPNCPGCREG